MVSTLLFQDLYFEDVPEEDLYFEDVPEDLDLSDQLHSLSTVYTLLFQDLYFEDVPEDHGIASPYSNH